MKDDLDIGKDIAVLVRDSKTKEEGIERALDAILAGTRTTCGTVHLLSQADGLLRLAAARQIPPPVLEKIRVIPVGKGMAGVAVESRKPVTTCNLQTDDAGGVIRQGARATGAQGALALPMLDGEDAVGALGVATLEPRDFTPGEVERLLAIGRALASALRARA
jgi:GAF domain-containing protein